MTEAEKDSDIIRDLVSMTRTIKIFGGLITVACIGVVTWNLNLGTKLAAVERENAIQAPRIERLDSGLAEFRRDIVTAAQVNALQTEQISVLKIQMSRFEEKLDRVLERATGPK